MVTITKASFEKNKKEQLKNSNFSFHYNIQRPLLTGSIQGNSSSVTPTLFELDKVDPFTMYDIFDVDCFYAEVQSGHDVGKIHAYVSLLKTSPHIKMEGKILDKDTGVVLETIQPTTVKNATKVELKDDLYIEKGVDPKKLVLSVAAQYEVDGQLQNVLKNTDINLKAGELEYRHLHPKKKKNRDDLPVKLGNPQNNPPVKHNLETDPNHIVICLVRYPDDYGDIDYICGFGPSSYPYGAYLGIPGSGRFAGPVDSTFIASKSSGYCVIKDLSGGGCMAASSNADKLTGLPTKTITLNTGKDESVYTSEPGDLTFEGEGNEATFSMLGVWHNNSAKVIYTEAGQFKKKYFHMNIYLTLCFQINGMDVYFDGLITSEDTNDLNHDYIHQVLPLSIMYGCLMKGTLIATAEGTKKIEDIRIGDKLAPAFDGRVPIVRNVWRGMEAGSLIQITDEEGNNVCLTEDHPVMTENGIVPAKWVTAELNIFSKGGKPTKVKSVSSFEYTGEVYNLDVEADGDDDMAHFFIAGGIVVGDNMIQNKSKGEIYGD